MINRYKKQIIVITISIPFFLIGYLVYSGLYNFNRIEPTKSEIISLFDEIINLPPLNKGELSMLEDTVYVTSWKQLDNTTNRTNPYYISIPEKHSIIEKENNRVVRLTTSGQNRITQVSDGRSLITLELDSLNKEIEVYTTNTTGNTLQGNKTWKETLTLTLDEVGVSEDNQYRSVGFEDKSGYSGVISYSKTQNNLRVHFYQISSWRIYGNFYFKNPEKLKKIFDKIYNKVKLLNEIQPKDLR